MNRNDFRELARIRLREARVLLRNRCFQGAYYLSGYVIECAIKACIAKQTKRFDFPDKRTVQDSHSHDLEQLIRVGGLELEMKLELAANSAFSQNWDIVKDWEEGSRYRKPTDLEAKAMYQAVADPVHGVLQWLKHRW